MLLATAHWLVLEKPDQLFRFFASFFSGKEEGTISPS
jgi:hypothetical protein